ncbi:SDR family NAD(P)-dependent oxidoreductase [Leucothrix sargassi]|nr:SDR family NAD(P)-dependent oxidoreductase [Leucothrix sargassi]
MIKNDKKIAIIGMACRLPGQIKTPENYWTVLSQGQDVVSEIDEKRWGTDFYSHENKKEPGKSYTFAAGVLDDIDQFDASFFGISPREAEQMDPQQRLLLELAWEAIEDSCTTIEKLNGSDCAVYMGIASNDYAHRRTDDLASLDAYTMTGNTASVASNRISYNFNLQGPSVSVDTACSSSLVAVHQACKSIWAGEASSALCGGINMLLHPFPFVGFSKASMLSPDGRCKAFDNSGNGYVRAEGAGVLLLKPLAQAEADGDHIHAVIVNSGVNCDGSTSGITVPGMETQSALLDKVYNDANIKAEDLSYLEAHGTGTAVGDPLEANSLGKSLGKQRSSDQPLLIGSAKTNLGHLETASGMAGLLKAVLTVKNKAIPASLHFDTPNENIDFSGLNLEVVTELTPLETREQPHLVGVNSFGFGGANAHVLIEEYKPANKVVPTNAPEETPPLVISARSNEALKAVAKQLSAHLQNSTDIYYATAYSAFHKKTRHAHAAAIYGSDTTDIIAQLEEYSDSGSAKQVVVQSYTPNAKLAFVFTGNGCQWQGMGQALYANCTEFKASFDEISDLLESLSTEYSLTDELHREPEDSRLALTEIAQPLLFAIQVALVKYLANKGTKPEAVIGHSVGEVAAAWASGALTLEQATQVIHHRSQAQGLTKGAGRMAAVGLGREALSVLLEKLALLESVTIAGDNSPNNTTAAGDLEDLLTLEASCNEQGTFFRILDLDYAFHSPAMDSIEDQVLSSLAALTPSNTNLPFISTVTGKALDSDQLDANYWWNNIRQPVQFNQGVQSLSELGIDTFLEIGPHAILRSYVNDYLSTAGLTGTLLHTLKRKHDNEDHLYQNTLKTLLSGVSIDSSCLFTQETATIKLPTYPWQRQRYWYPLTSEGYDLVNRKREHPLLGYRLKDSDIIWENNIDTTELPYLKDHAVDGAVVLPAAAFIEMALAASALWGKTETHHLEMVEIPTPILLEDNQAKKVRFHLDISDGTFRITSRDRMSKDEWVENARGRLLQGSFRKPKLAAFNDELLIDENRVTGAQHYEMAESVGLSYGPNFQAVTSVHATQQWALAELALPEALHEDLASYHLHPSLLDSGFQVLVDICRSTILGGAYDALIPIQVGHLHLLQPQAGAVKQVLVEVTGRSPRSLVANFSLLDEQGIAICVLEKCRFRQMQFKSVQPKKINQYHWKTQLLPHLNYQVAFPSIDTSTITTAAETYLSSGRLSEIRDQHFNEYMLLLDMMAASYAFEAIQLITGDSTSFKLDEVRSTLNEAQVPLFNQLCTLLQENDLLTVDGEVATLNTDEEVPDAAGIWQYIYQASPSYLPDLLTLSQCGENLAPLLKGDVDSDDLLSPTKSNLLEQLVEGSPSYTPFNQALLAATDTLITQCDSNQLVRILLLTDYPEQLTSDLISVLGDQAYELIIASQDDGKLGVINRSFENNDSLETMTLDINNIDLALEPCSVDIIIAPHILHQLNNRNQGLKRLSDLLKANGQLLILERAADRFTDLTFGTSPDWWSDQQSRLMDADSWLSQLESQGFTNTAKLQDEYSDAHQGVYLLSATNAQQSVEALTADTTFQQHWLVINPASNSADTPLYVPASVDINLSHLTHGDKFGRLSTSQLTCDLESPEACKQLFAGQAFDKVIYLATDQAELSTPIHRLKPLLGSLESLESIPQLVIVTRGAATASDVRTEAYFDPKASTLWGFARVISNEYPDLSSRLIDIGEHPLELESLNLAQEILHNDGNDEVILSTNGRHLIRMEQYGAGQDQVTETYTPATLDFQTPGSLKNLYWREQAPCELGEDEIEIRPIASGLNFRDVMYAMGMLSDEAVENGFAGATIGMETAGIVTNIGSNVSEFSVGDEVLGFAPACFSNRVITGTTATAHKPKEWTFEEAATVPTTFFTVYYAFIKLAQLEEGERVLIHGASGGVGIAAVQLARHLGAEVFASAGTPEKRAFVKNMGAHHVLDSRSLSFESDVLEITEGEGVDVVLNSVFGEAVNRNLSVLKPFGRFLELGKRDFYANSRIGLRPFRNNITYFGIDADQLLTEKPKLAKRLFADLMKLFEAKELHPLPHRVFDANRIQDAFSYMQQSRQIGKVIVRLPEQLPVTKKTTAQTLRLNGEATYIVTGGLSGFGLTTAKWLAEKGAKHLTLLGRKGAVTEDAITAVAEFEARGVTVNTPPCDVTDPKQLGDVFNSIANSGMKLAGVIHAATVFEDALIRNMTTEQLDNVINAKAAGAWNLHELTKNLSLDFFVLYSSATTLFGNPGQSNYVAANYMLENLAYYRHQQGLPASYAAWGAISDVGFLARNKDTQDALVSRFGGEALTSTEALKELEQLIMDDSRCGSAFINFDWKAIKRSMPSAKSLKFTQQNEWLERHSGGDDGEDFFVHIQGKSEKEIKALIMDIVTREIAQILRMSAEKIDVTSPVFDLGMDSLMGMELLLAIEERFKAKLPIMTLTEGGSIQKIADKIYAKMNDGTKQESDDSVTHLAAKHGTSISDDELATIKNTDEE